MWDHLDRSEAWSILEEAARSEDPAIATMASRTPAARLTAASQERLISIIICVLNHHDPKVRCDGLARCQTLPVVDPQHRLLPFLSKAMTSPVVDEVHAAASAVFSTYDGTHASAIASSVGELLQNRRALTVVATAIQARATWNRRAMQPIVDKVLSVLNADPLTITLRVRLAATCLEESDLVQFLEEHVDELHAEALMEAVELLSVRNWGGSVEALPQNSTAVPLLALSGINGQSIETRFRSHPDPRLRRLVLACLVAESKSGRGWTVGLRERLSTLQQDTSPLVADAAVFTFPNEIPEPTPT